jgi:hypothetical protein
VQTVDEVLTDNEGDALDDDIPESFSVAVIMESRKSMNPWVDEVREIVAVASYRGVDQHEGVASVINQQSDMQQLLFPGFRITLYADECESYYHNMMSSEPRCYVVASDDESGKLVPFLVTLSYDEANAYLEGEETVFAVPVPPELYRWSEKFVLRNYVPEKRIKRKRKDWKKS